MRRASTCLLLALLSLEGLAQDGPGSARPPRREGRPPRGQGQGRGSGAYSLAQATSDEAQRHTLAFSALAFLTGDWRASTFLPPGKVADFFGFQYLRDVDAAGGGHNPRFLDRAAGAVQGLLDEAQRQVFAQEAVDEAARLEALARRRWPLVVALHRTLDGTALDEAAVRAWVEGIFEADAALAWRRARAFGRVYRSLTEAQRRTLAGWTFGDHRTWPEADPRAPRPGRRGAPRLESVANMTLASEFLSWALGSVEADAYFCPERHGTCFGGFHLKDLPAMGQRDFDIPTNLTGDTGAAFLEALTPAQRAAMDALVSGQRGLLAQVVEVRREMSRLLRGFQGGDDVPEAQALALGRRYGALDAELHLRYVRTFAALGRSLTDDQRARIRALRGAPVQEEGSAYLFSDRVPMAQAPDASSLLRGRP